MKDKDNYFLKFKSFLRKFSLKGKKIKKIFWFYLMNDKKTHFDIQKQGTELLAINNFNEKYIVNSNDRVIGISLYINGSYEFDTFLHTLAILENKIKTETLIDIGANIGSICIPAVKRGIFKNCLAIEPEPYNFDLLTKNIFINNLSNKIQTFNVALGQFDNEKINLH